MGDPNMCKDTIDQSPAKATKISDSLQSVIFNSIRNVVSDDSGRADLSRGPLRFSQT